MPLTVQRKNHLMRDLNKGHYKKDDPAGDVFYSYTLKFLSGEAVVATVDVGTSTGRYCPAGEIDSIRIRAVWVKKRDLYHPSLMNRQSEEKLVEDNQAVVDMITREWEAWCVKAGLVECME